MAYTNITYNNPNKVNASKVDNSNRFKINDKMLAMMAKHPALGIGYLIGSAIGDSYFGKKRQKSTEDAVNEALKQYGQMHSLQTGVTDWDAANKILDAYSGGSKNAMNTDSAVDAMNQSKGWVGSGNNESAAAPAATEPAAAIAEAASSVVPQDGNGKFSFAGLLPSEENGYHLGDYSDVVGTEYTGDRGDVERQYAKQAMGLLGGSPRYFAPPTPQQANAPAVTLDNVGALGGMVSAQDMWNNMQNQGTYNNGNTGFYTNGIRNMGNVVTANPAQANVMAKRAQELENMRRKALNQIGQNPPTPQYFIKR